MSKTAFNPHTYAEHMRTTGLVASDGTILWRWKRTHWIPYPETDGERHAYRYLVQHDPDHVSADYARKCYAAAVRWVDPLPKPPTNQVILPLLNGCLHLVGNAFVLRPHDKALGLQHVIECGYDQNAAEPKRFLAFLDRVLPDPAVRARVQEYIGYTFLPDARFQRAQFWQGDGANGKGVLANITQALHHHCAAVQLDNLSGFKLAGLVGASLIYCDEAPQRRMEEQLLKSLIAGEAVQVDRKFRDPLTLRVSAKWIVLANHFPAISDQSGGFWRRWDIVPFSVTIPEPEREPLLAETIIKHELSGVLNWAIDGLLRLLRRGAFEVVLPAPMQQLLCQAKTETNSVMAWYGASGCSLSPQARTRKVAVYDHYAQWCRDNGMAPVASPRFWKRLAEVAGGPVLGERVRVADGTQPRMCNIQLPLELGLAA